MSQIDALLQRLQQGVPVGDLSLVALETRPGRFVEETYLALGVTDGRERVPVADLILYRGRPPYYRAWVEIFAQRPTVPLGEATLNYFDSGLEKALLNAVAAALGPGERLFVDCEADAETLQGIRWGFPEVVTRLGFLLYQLGFTWFKGWYYPEGFREGGQKLQAEKPVDENTRFRHERGLEESVHLFLARVDDLPPHPAVARAIERAHTLVSTDQAR